MQKYTDICFQGASRMQFWESKNGTLKMRFMTPKRKMFAGNF